MSSIHAKPSREEFENDYKSMLFGEVLEKYGISRGTMYSWIREFDIELKRKLVTLEAGDVLGPFTVLKKVENTKAGAHQYQVQCVCGKTIIKTTGHLVATEARGANGCGHCAFFKGVGEMPGRYWSSICNGANKRAIPVNVTMDYAWGLFLSQSRKCALTGIEIRFGSNQNASLDRIDSKKPYEIGNLQWVHKIVNRMKNKLTEQEYVMWCKHVARHHGMIDSIACAAKA